MDPIRINDMVDRKIISSLQEEREKYINNQYTYQYHLKNKYSSIEKRIKY